MVLQETDDESTFSAGVSAEDDGEDRGKFGSSYQPTSTLRIYIKSWNAHLATPEGGNKTNRQIGIMCQQVEKISTVVAGEKWKLRQITSVKKVYPRFFKKHLEARKADPTAGLSVNTLVVYSYNLEKFLKYVSTRLSTETSPDMRLRLRYFIDAQAHWRECWKKTRREQRSQREWAEIQRLVTPDQLKDMKDSPHALLCDRHRSDAGAGG
jgi:hypothetical protein